MPKDTLNRELVQTARPGMTNDAAKEYLTTGIVRDEPGRLARVIVYTMLMPPRNVYPFRVDKPVVEMTDFLFTDPLSDQGRVAKAALEDTLTAHPEAAGYPTFGQGSRIQMTRLKARFWPGGTLTLDPNAADYAFLWYPRLDTCIADTRTGI